MLCYVVLVKQALPSFMSSRQMQRQKDGQSTREQNEIIALLQMANISMIRIKNYESSH